MIWAGTTTFILITGSARRIRRTRSCWPFSRTTASSQKVRQSRYRLELARMFQGQSKIPNRKWNILFLADGAGDARRGVPGPAVWTEEAAARQSDEFSA